MKVPSLKPQRVVRALKRAGFKEIRQTGSHLILVNKMAHKITSVPMHNKPLKRGLLFGIIKQSGLTTKEFLSLL